MARLTGKVEFHRIEADGRADRARAGSIEPEALSPVEREVFDRWSDSRGTVSDRDIDTLLRQNVMLRRLIAELVASAGRPRATIGGYVADVPTELLEVAGAHGDYSDLPDPEAVDKEWY